MGWDFLAIGGRVRFGRLRTCDFRRLSAALRGHRAFPRLNAARRNCLRAEVSNVRRSARNSSRVEESFVYAGCGLISSKRGLVKCQMFSGVSAIARRVAQEGHDLQPEPQRRRFHGAAFRRIHEANDAEFGGMRAIYCKL